MNANIPEFKRLMKINNYTQSKLAKKLGLSRVGLNRVLNGKRHPGGRFMSAFKHKFPRENLDKFFYV